MNEFIIKTLYAEHKVSASSKDDALLHAKSVLHLAEGEILEIKQITFNNDDNFIFNIDLW